MTHITISLYFPFATSFSADGSLLAVGSSEYPQGATNGAVFIFVWHKDLKKWKQIAGPIQPSNTEPDSEFGEALALSYDGRVLAVGAHDQGASGGAWIFERQKGSDVWKEVAFLQGSDLSDGADFGFSIDLNAKVYSSAADH